MSLRRFTDFENSIEEEAVKHAATDATGAKKELLTLFHGAGVNKKVYHSTERILIELLDDNKIEVKIYDGRVESRVILQVIGLVRAGFETEEQK